MSDTSIPTRKLGKDGPTVPALGFGLMGLSVAYGPVPSDESRFAVLDRAVEIGATFWDTSDLYGDSERLLGKWFQRTGKRDEIFLATKYGYIGNPMDHNINSSAEYTREACAKCLKTLGIDCIDLFYVHHVNPETPIEETMRALVELRSEGKIKYIGLSSVTSTTLRRACKIAHVAAVQAEYSAFVLDVEGPVGSDMLATCRELGVALVPFSPLGRGLLTTNFAQDDFAIDDKKDVRRALFPRFHDENRATNMKLVNEFKAFADKKNCTTSQLALAWLLKQGDNVIPIPGTKKIKYLEENWGALKVHLTDDDEKEIRHFVETAEIAGPRLPAQYLKNILVENKEES